MPILIDCPTCHQQVTVRSGGQVDRHMAGTRVCTFTKTASSDSRPKQVFSDSDRRKAAARALMAEQEQERQVARAEARARKQARRAEREPKPARVTVECPRCKQMVTEKDGGVLAAHQRPSDRWCGGGVQPTPGQRKKAAKRRSVWTTSGGLPTLGRQ